MSMTLTPSSGPMISFAPDARSFERAMIFRGLVTSARPEDQGRQAYGRMRARHPEVRAHLGEPRRMTVVVRPILRDARKSALLRMTECTWNVPRPYFSSSRAVRSSTLLRRLQQ